MWWFQHTFVSYHRNNFQNITIVVSVECEPRSYCQRARQRRHRRQQQQRRRCRFSDAYVNQLAFLFITNNTSISYLIFLCASIFILADFQTNDSLFTINGTAHGYTFHVSHSQWYSKVIMDDGISWLFSFWIFIGWRRIPFFSAILYIFGYMYEYTPTHFIVETQQFNQTKYIFEFTWHHVAIWLTSPLSVCTWKITVQHPGLNSNQSQFRLILSFLSGLLHLFLVSINHY